MGGRRLARHLGRWVHIEACVGLCSVPVGGRRLAWHLGTWVCGCAICGCAVMRLWVVSDSLGISAGGLLMLGSQRCYVMGSVLPCLLLHSNHSLNRFASLLRPPCAAVTSAMKALCLLLSPPLWFTEAVLHCPSFATSSCSHHRHDGPVPAAQHRRAALARVPDLPRCLGHALLVSAPLLQCIGLKGNRRRSQQACCLGHAVLVSFMPTQWLLSAIVSIALPLCRGERQPGTPSFSCAAPAASILG